MTEEIKNAAGAQEATPVAEVAKAETVKEAPETFRFVLGEKLGERGQALQRRLHQVNLRRSRALRVCQKDRAISWNIRL